MTPFTVPVMEEEVAWIRTRVAAWRPFDEPVDAGWRYGANQAYMQHLRDHWLGGYDWPGAVDSLNRWSQAIAQVEGHDLHFVHVRSPRADAVPLLMSHGWPSSVFEFWRVIEPLTDPVDPALPAFHLVLPSLPGYAWSGKPRAPIGPRAISRLYDRLMTGELGYERYMAQGGDWGSLITGWLGLDAPACAAIHLNGYGLRAADMRPASEADRAWLAQANAIRQSETAYLHLQATKPQSLGFAMMDSPMGVAAWLAEKYCGWSDLAGGRIGGFADPPFSLDDVLTQIMIMLTTRSFATSTWLYRAYFEETPHTVPGDRRVAKPVGVANFPHDLLGFPPRAMVERAYDVVHWTDMPRGGHFAAWEQAGLFVDDIRAFTRGLSL